jgi:nitrite reductase/ring-hydroxylating ferredoxin subunit
MKAYFSFMRQAGEHLDPKTRALISIITKVAAQSEDGFRQYLSRGLQAGLTANEVIDGILMAFPALGLTKITWAMELILGLDIPEFRLEALQRTEGTWNRVAEAESIPVDRTVLIHAGGRDLFVRGNGKTYKVYDNRCPHQVTSIPELAISRNRITCPKHGWVFDAASGACIEKGNRPLRELESRIESGWLLAFW